MFNFEEEEFYKYFMVRQEEMGIKFRPKKEYIESEYGTSFSVKISDGEIHFDMQEAYLFVDGIEIDKINAIVGVPEQEV